jgi:hypothetical protein
MTNPMRFGTCVAISKYETDGRREKLAAAKVRFGPNGPQMED